MYACGEKDILLSAELPVDSKMHSCPWREVYLIACGNKDVLL